MVSINFPSTSFHQNAFHGFSNNKNFNGPKEKPNLSIPNSIKMVPIQIAQSLSIKLNVVVDLIGQDQRAMSSCHHRQGFDLLRRARASWAMRFLTAGGRRWWLEIAYNTIEVRWICHDVSMCIYSSSTIDLSMWIGVYFFMDSSVYEMFSLASTPTIPVDTSNGSGMNRCDSVVHPGG